MLLYHSSHQMQKKKKIIPSPKDITFYNHVAWTGCSTAEEYRKLAGIDFYAFSRLPKDARLNWFNTHLKPKLEKISRRLHSIMEDGTLAEAFTSGKFAPDCTGSGKLNWGLSPLGFATRDARQTLKHQRQCEDFRQASHTTIRDVAKLRADNPPVPDGFDELANLIEDAELFCKSTWGVKCILYLMLQKITAELYSNKVTLKSNYNFQYRVAGVILHYICLILKKLLAKGGILKDSLFRRKQEKEKEVRRRRTIEGMESERRESRVSHERNRVTDSLRSVQMQTLTQVRQPHGLIAFIIYFFPKFTETNIYNKSSKAHNLD